MSFRILTLKLALCVTFLEFKVGLNSKKSAILKSRTRGYVTREFHFEGPHKKSEILKCFEKKNDLDGTAGN